MSQPVKLSDQLVLDARVTSQLTERSIAGQIEFWASLGKSLEPVLSGDQALALRKSGKAAPMSQLLASVDAPEGRKRVADYLAGQSYPHYRPADKKGLLIRIEEDGTETIGRFVNREFVPSKSIGSKRASKKNR